MQVSLVAALDSAMAVVSVALQDMVVDQDMVEDQDTVVAPSAKPASPVSAVNAIKEKRPQPNPASYLP